MSRNGASLADWQDIYNGVNERRKAVMNWLSPADLVPVLQSKNHVTHGDIAAFGTALVNKIPAGSFCDPYTPLTFYTWNTAYDTGSEPNGINSLNMYKYVHEFGSVPAFGSPLAGSGWFLDWIDDALGYMTKCAAGWTTIHETGGNPSVTQYWSKLDWNTYGAPGVPANAVYDYIAGEWIPGLTINTFSELWDYAVQNLHVTQNAGTTEVSIGAGTHGCDIRFSNWTLPHPGVIPADLTFYYSAFGDNVGYAPTNYTQGNVQVHGYGTITKQNASSASRLMVGWDSSVIPSSPPAAGYSKVEYLQNFYAVWDFAPYFQY